MVYREIGWYCGATNGGTTYGQTYGTDNELSLSEGETYFLVMIIRATNLLGNQPSRDGMSIKFGLLFPGHVKDSDVIGFYINYWPSVTLLSVNWDGFGFEGVTTGSAL
ncbi:uncharacterized protein [Ptychodera flava]|uniref:uncharacterized protein isoform X1 n=1 Tax=Ptychodera flava TaxID=63121 RepID=UPI00396A19D3